MRALAPDGDPGRGLPGLAAAFLAAFVLHGAALVGLALHAPTPTAAPGESTISIDLAPQVAEAETRAPAEQARSVPAPADAKPVEATEAAAAAAPPDTAEIRPEEATTAEASETGPVVPTEAIVQAPPEDQVVTAIAEEGAPLPAPAPVVAQVPEPAKPEPAKPEPPRPDPAKLEAERAAKREAKRVAERVAEREARREAEQEARREAAAEARRKAAREAKAKAAAKAAVANAGSGQQTTASASRQSSAGRAAAGNDPRALRAWQGALSSAIRARMNRDAAAGTVGGVAVVRFTVSRSGQVLSAGLASSSGIGAIDNAALATVRGSLPAAPAGIGVASLPVTVPLRFNP